MKTSGNQVISKNLVGSATYNTSKSYWDFGGYKIKNDKDYILVFKFGTTVSTIYVPSVDIPNIVHRFATINYGNVSTSVVVKLGELSSSIDKVSATTTGENILSGSVIYLYEV